MNNNVSSPFKKTKLDYLLNIFVLIAFFVQLLYCIFSTFFYHLYNYLYKEELYYVYDDSFGKLFIVFFTFLILYQTLIPISLYVTLEGFYSLSIMFFLFNLYFKIVIKLVQVFFINNDVLMYDEETDTRANSKTSNLNDSLFFFFFFFFYVFRGQIEHVFMDKTGF
jgi:magnesium-transporting ATPase (P-type)